ncbi:MAG TPA: enoyl-CoA hydratase/isomerase family protein [Blastocatellia bacterium]|nr:enoyl-CoA hydratase/isomerase family protein [Blastocatellia bacterium]
MNTDAFSHLNLLLRGPDIAIIQINRPQFLNTLSRVTLCELSLALTELSDHFQLRKVIVTGTQGVFSVGADLNEVAQLDAASAIEFSRLGQSVFAQLRQSKAMTIAAIDGHCLGGGLDLALSCSVRLASPRSTFQHPGARRGIITGWGGTALLPRLVGRASALRLFLTAERIDAREALRIGLIDEINDDVIPRAEGMSMRLSR